MGISLGLVGLGSFGGGSFAALFKSHPAVDRIGLCDLEPERIAKYADNPFFKDKLNPRDRYASLDAICKADFDALVIITQPWLHAPQCIQAMEAGKHVYSAVPIISIPDDDEILDWCDKLVNTCRKTGMYYMLGETTYYRPQAQFCRRKAAAGEFGDFVYAEGEYIHDIDSWCNLRQVRKSRSIGKAGQEWERKAAEYVRRGCLGGPMHYPTHSTSGPVCVMKAHAVKATCYGYRNKDGDPEHKNSAFSNEMALFKMSNGAAVRIAEMRETPGSIDPTEGEIFRVMGTRGTFTMNTWYQTKRPDYNNIDYDKLPTPSVTQLKDPDMFQPLPKDVQSAFKAAMHQDKPPSDLQNMEFVPGGHGGSHPYLVHEFVDAVANGRQPAINIWESVRYMAMGVMAHKSALKDGETLSVPDWGDAP